VVGVTQVHGASASPCFTLSLCYNGGTSSAVELLPAFRFLCTWSV